MPTNLPAEYYDAEERYKAAESPSERIRLLEELISTVPKHKGTDKLRADLRRRLSKLKSSAHKSKGASRHDSAWQFDKEGAGQVVIIGLANVGKSALLQALTNASPEISAFPFTTRLPTPGMMMVGDVPIQIIDTPPLDREYLEPELFDLIRRADILIIVLDLQTYPIEQLQRAIDILAEHHISPITGTQNVAQQTTITQKQTLIVANKCDDDELQELFEIFCELMEEDWSCIPISAVSGRNLQRLQQEVFSRLGIMRVYAKPPGKEADLTAPFVLRDGSTVEEFAGKVHKDFVKNLKMARVWGSSSFEGQIVGRDYVLRDGDIIELRT
jgi:small GTP-binding protein